MESSEEGVEESSIIKSTPISRSLWMEIVMSDPMMEVWMLLLLLMKRRNGSQRTRKSSVVRKRLVASGTDRA